MAHRDLKPANILISDDRQSSILTDFGSMTERSIEINNSRKSQQIQEWAAENCSMFYRAPELFEPRIGTSVNEKADTWSLGCILYAMMFNVGPFDYVAEKGDSIALAVANAKYFISNQIRRPECLIKILKQTILYEQNERENLSKILNDLESISNLGIENENQQVV
jgi:serine/threonine kinase 16